MTAKKFARPVAALALILAAGLPAHAGGGSSSPLCNPAPIQCNPTPPQCNPTPKKPACGPNAVPEASDVALLGVGSLFLLTAGMRAVKLSRPTN